MAVTEYAGGGGGGIGEMSPQPHGGLKQRANLRWEAFFSVVSVCLHPRIESCDD